jgi:hypothetical protein
MAYFNHAFCKMLLGQSNAANSNGFVTTGSVADFAANATNGVGSFGFVDQSSFNAATPWPVVAAPAGAEPLTLVATSVLNNDKIGPFHGGYQETTKSKMINPKYISRFYKVEAAAAQTNMIGVGATPNLDLAGADAACCPEFFCNENYHLRVDVKGSPALRMLNHHAYEVAASYTGCCDGPVPELVDPFDVMSEWATYINNDPILSGADHGPVFTPLFDQRLVNVGVTVSCDDPTFAAWDFYLPDNAQAGTAGLYFEADGTTLTADGTAFVAEVEAATGVTFGTVAPISTYTSVFDPAAPNCCAGLVVQAAFVETQFGDCTFMPTDHYEIEPLELSASMLDETGDPCVFDQLCISDGKTPSGANSQTIYPAILAGRQTMGTGESVLRDLILGESYNQNDFNTSRDLRIREITQGYDISDAVDRNALYDCYYILHSVPRFNNPSGTFDNDQYLIKIPVFDGFNGAAFEAFMATWLANANNPVTLETF